MLFVRFLLKAVVGFVVAFGAIWAYDSFKSTRLAKEQRQVTALAESAGNLRALQVEHLRYGLQATSMYRSAVSEVYYSTGKLPASNAEAGLRPASENRSSKIESLEVQAGGVLLARFANFPHATGVWLRLVPEQPSGNLPVNWKCESNFPDIEVLLPACDHRTQ